VNLPINTCSLICRAGIETEDLENGLGDTAAEGESGAN